MVKLRPTFFLGCGILVAGLVACSKGGGQVTTNEAARATAKTTFETVCMVCHGMKGKGDGPGSVALDPKPRDLAEKAWQTSVTDQHIKNVITMGGAAVGKSPIMPAHPQFKNDAQVLEALVAHVRGLAN